MKNENIRNMGALVEFWNSSKWIPTTGKSIKREIGPKTLENSLEKTALQKWNVVDWMFLLSFQSVIFCVRQKSKLQRKEIILKKKKKKKKN